MRSPSSRTSTETSRSLEAALVAVEESDPDLVVFGGDLVWGPLPRETLDRRRRRRRRPSSSGG